MTDLILGTTGEKLKSILSEYKEEYKRECRNSRDAYMKTLGAGANIPAEGVLYGNESRTRFSETCNKLSTSAREIVDEELEKVKAKKGEAPSSDTVNTLLLASTRTKVSEADLDDLIHSHGGNYQAYRTIQDIAAKNDIRLVDHPLVAREKSIIDLQNNLNKTLTIRNAESGHANDGFIALLSAEVDRVFPNE